MIAGDAVRVGAPASGPAAATSGGRKIVICTIRPGRRSPGFSNSARIRTAVSATGWICGVNERDLAAESLLLDRQRLAASRRSKPRLDLDDLALLDAEGIVKGHISFGTELLKVAQLDHRFVGPHALAGVLLPLEHDSVERCHDRVLVERPLGQLELRPGDAPVLLGFLDLGFGDLQVALGLGHVFSRDHARADDR